MRHYVHCYAEGVNGKWEAFCLDFDLAVQGESFEEVYHALHENMVAYGRYISELPEDERQAFLNRKAPLSLRLRFLWYVLKDILGREASRKQRAEFMAPCMDLAA